MNRTQLFQKLFFAAPFLFILQTSNAQFLQTIDAANNGPYTPQSLISNVLLGNGVDVSNITYNGSPRAVGYFSGGTQSIGIERGILLTTGFAAKPGFGFGPTDPGGSFASNSNGSTATDANLSNIATSPLRDVAVYTITFIPTSDTLRFRYCFASEEYPEYSCTQFNDIFGFFIQGPGYPTPTNIARVPGTNLPVAINNIHPFNNQNGPVPNPCPPFNVQYYNSNNNSAVQPVYDGFTDVFTAMAVVTPCQPYTIKLAIADVFDSAYDSGVFLEAKSFGTTALRVEVNTPSADGSIAEGCTPGSITFTLGDPQSTNYPININTFGTATPGVDFQPLPSNIVIPAGQTQISFPITAIQDNQTENVEVIAFSVQIDACNRDTVYLYLRDNPIVPPLMQDTTICTAGAPILLNATIPVPTPQPPTFTNTQPLTIPDNAQGVSSSINVAGVQPTKLGPGVVRSVCMNIIHQYDDDLDLFLLSPGGQVLELSTDNGGSGDNYTSTCFTPTATVPINFPGPQAPASAAPFTGDFLPEGQWTDLWDTPNRPTNGTWRLQTTDDFLSFQGALQDWSITFAPTYEITYQWAASPDITCLTCPITIVSPLASSTYFVTATDIYGCTATDNAHVEITTMTANAAVNDQVSCFGGNDGMATANTNIGGLNTFKWSDPAAQNTATASNLPIGSYTVTVTNVGGCSATSSVTLTQPPLLDLTTSSQDAVCFGQPSGTASAQVIGGTMPYQYAWSNGQTTANLPTAGPGTYTLVVTDANGCTDTGTVTINQPSAIQASASTVQNVSCFDGANGQISLSSSGGVLPLSFQWSNAQSGANVTGLLAGTYTATVTDANGCSVSLQQVITQPADLTVFATPVPAKCFGSNNGELHVDINGGTASYSTNWQGPGGFTGTGANLLNLIAGNYVATVTDQKGCTETLVATVTEPPNILLSLPQIADTICFGASNGKATVVPAGGTAPFSFLWNANGQASATASGLSSQEYQVTVTDSNGCSKTAKTAIIQKAQLNAFVQPTLPSCHDGADGTATVISVFYGATPANLSTFNYVWNTSPAQQNITANNLKANQTYSVTLSDADGCSAQYGFTMGNPISIEAAITGFKDVKCYGEANGWASANASGGTAPYTWFWGAGTSPADSIGLGLSAGITRVTITDAKGCPSVVAVTLKEPGKLQVQISPTHVKCFGDRTGTAIGSANGGTAPYSFNWWNGSQSKEIQQLEAGIFGLSVTDANGCITPATVEIIQPLEPISGTADMRAVRCYGQQNGQIIFVPAGGTPPYLYALDNKPFNGSSIQIGLKAGIYTPRIKDANGCIFDLATVEVTQMPQMAVDLGPDIRILLGQDTQLIAQVFNYSGNYQLSWTPADSIWLSCMSCANPAVYSLENNHYFEVYAIDDFGCRSEDQILVSVDKPRRVHVPTAFSPNGDFVNDLLLVHGQKNSTALMFRIYDRWGEMVYEAKDFAFNDENTGWDGNFRGQPMDPGVYVWVLEVEYVDGAKEVYKGNTTLIR